MSNIPKAVTYVTISKHTLTVMEREKYLEACKNLPDGLYKWSLERCYSNRTLKQNAASWGVIYDAMQPILSDAMGEYIPLYAPDDEVSVHNILKGKCLPKAYVERLKIEYEAKQYVDKTTGEILYSKPFRLTTTKMTTVEMSEYFENIRIFAREFFNAELPEIRPN